MSQKEIWKNRNTSNIVLSVLFIGLMWGVYRDMADWFRPQLVNATRVSYTVLLAVFFEVFITSLAFITLWRPNWLKPLNKWRHRAGWFRWMLVGVYAVVSGLIFLHEKSGIFNGTYARISLMLLFLGVASWLATDDSAKNFSWKGVLKGSVLFASIFLFAYRLQKVSNHPFSIFWSEGNRIWDYSIPFGRRLYNFPAGERIFSLTDVGRRTLWGIPYLLPGVQIWMVRFWDVVMFTVPYALLGWMVFGTERKNNRGVYLLLGLWMMLFLNQGPIYTPLILAAWVVVLARKTPYWLNIVLVLAASYYARTSRFTWMFAPGMWAAMLAFLDQDWVLSKHWIKNWLQPIFLGVAGIVGGYVLPEIVNGGGGSQTGMLSAEGVEQMTGRQPLLWDRLLPNATYAPGILLGLFLATAPLVILMIYLVLNKKWKMAFWQKLAGLAFMFAFLGVGIVISVKIGGGSNLHNLDMFLVGLALLGGVAWEKGGRELFTRPDNAPVWVQIMMLALVLIPAANVIREPSHSSLPPSDLVEDALAETQDYVAKAREEGEVLFMDQRQLLTFGYVGDVPLVVEYEKKLLMDEAMASNEMYFADYYADLSTQRFSLIVSEPLRIEFQGGEYDFGNENDAWVKWVSIPMLCYYEPVVTYREVGLELLVPRETVIPPVDGVICP